MSKIKHYFYDDLFYKLNIIFIYINIETYKFNFNENIFSNIKKQ